jgi:hypothetical protein
MTGFALPVAYDLHDFFTEGPLRRVPVPAERTTSQGTPREGDRHDLGNKPRGRPAPRPDTGPSVTRVYAGSYLDVLPQFTVTQNATVHQRCRRDQ